MLDFTPMLRLYGRFRQRRLHGLSDAQAQQAVLRRLCARAAGTRFGRDHDLGRVRTAEDFRKRTPVRGYREFWTEYWQQPFPVLTDCCWPGTIPFFALTSGTTTGATKYIPYTAAMARGAFRGMLDLFVHHLSHRPASRFLGGKAVMLSGDIALERQAPGIYSGAVSGITAQRVPRWLQPRVLPPREIAAIHDWPEKIGRLAPLSLAEDIRVLGGGPNWLLLFFDQIAKLRPGEAGRLASWFRNLELIIHGGVNFAPYRQRFRELMQGSHAETREAYSASEGFFAVADRGDGEGMRLITDLGIFYEFVPVSELDAPNPTRHWAATVEPGVEYAVLVSSCAGVWAYTLGDTVRFVDTRPMRLVVTGRTSYLLSVFGEHVIEEELAEAVAEAAAAIGTDIADYSVTSAMGSGSPPSGVHHWIVECGRAVTDPAEAGTFAATLDACLQRLNDDYREWRHKGFALRAPVIDFAPPGSFAGWMRRRGRMGGQNKVPRILHDAALFDDLKSYVANRAAEAAGA